VPGKDPMGRSHYWFVVKPLEPADEDSDRGAVENGYTSLTPLQVDLTNFEEFGRLAQVPVTDRR
jgi:5'-nucleotidase